LASANAPVCVRRAQEAMELSAKAALRRLAVEYPREHDVGEAMEAAADRFPQGVRENLQGIKGLLAELAKVRGPAFYGYEEEGITPTEAFGREYALQTLERVKAFVQLLVSFAES